MVDGTLILNGKLLAITDPLPGARHDAHAFKAHWLDQLLDVSTLADKGYVGLNLATPTKRSPGQRLSWGQKKNNQVFNRLRSVVERGKSSGEKLAGSADPRLLPPSRLVRFAHKAIHAPPDGGFRSLLRAR